MKHKIFAMLSAMLLCGSLTAPAVAAENYRMGDVNADTALLI